MTAHLKQHAINSTADHSAGTPRTLLGTNVGGTALAELNYDNGGSTTAGEVPVRATGGDILVPTTPGQASAAASKSYVDLTKQGFFLKDDVGAATTVALAANTYANGTSGVGATLTGTSNAALGSIDGVTPVLALRVLVKNEAAPANNGIYTVTQVGDVTHPYILTRATDFDSSTSTPAKVQTGAFVLVDGGSTQSGEQWMLTTSGVITLGTTSLTWSQLFSPTAPTASDGITVSGFQVAAKAAAAASAQQYGGLVVNRTSDGTATASGGAGFLAIQTDNTTLEVSSSNQLREKIFKGIGTYAGASPTYSEMNTLCPAVHQAAYLESASTPGTSSVFHIYRRTTTNGTTADFAVVEMT